MITFIELCKVGDIFNCKSYYKKHKNVISNDVLKEAFRWSCEKGRINVAQWLYSLGNINIHAQDDDAFRWSCGYGHINVAQWLYSLGNINVHVENDEAFRWSCMNGKIYVAKWLHSLGNINIHAQDDLAFRWSCEYGHIDVAQWLYSLGNINIHVNNDLAFRWSCVKGRIDIAQWLYSLGNINIHAEHDEAFILSCQYDHVIVANWLIQICPDYSLEIENNKIKSYKVITPKDKIKDKTKDEIIEILNIKTSNEQISEQCMICLDDANLKLHDSHNHFMCFNCMIEWYINNNNQLKCHLCKTDISYQNMTLFI